MRVFVYEYLSGGGLYSGDLGAPSQSMMREGAAMLAALVADWREVSGVQLATLLDGRVAAELVLKCAAVCVDDRDSHASHFDRLVRQADFTFLVAPEIGGTLLKLTERVEQLGTQLLCPDAKYIALTSNKAGCGTVLAGAGIPTPINYRCQRRRDLAQLPEGPLVCKPNYGAGSWQVQLTSREQLIESWIRDRDVCVQVFCPGRPASVAVLCGGKRSWLWPPCWQQLTPPGFQYRGGATIEEPTLIERAQRLARRVVAALPATRGYIGIDIVLGAAPGGEQDVVIEVNPRLTTSYVALRHLATPKLAQALRHLAANEHLSLSFASGPVQFDAGGTVRIGGTPGNRIRSC